MSRFNISKTTAIIVGFSLLAISVSPLFAIEVTAESTNSVKSLKTATAEGAAGRPIIKEKLEVREEKIDNKIAALKEKIASRTATLKAKLQTFKNKKKAEITERINDSLNKINQKQTEQMQKNLNNMSGILDRLENRVNLAKPDIKDVSAAKTAIASAEGIIASASSAVSTQAQKDYTIQVTSEARVGIVAKAQRDKLHTDLQATRKMVIDAKQAVTNAIRVAKSGSSAATTSAKISDEKEGTNSGQQ